MAFQKPLCLFIILFFTLIPSSHSYNTIQVGGKDGWTLHPSEPYPNWAGRLRFQINDTLHFKYDGSSDSVLVVNRGDYDGCNVDLKSPISKLEGGDSLFKFDRSGPFYFITGNKSNCDQGQKLMVVVVAVRYPPPPPSVATPPGFPPSPAQSPVFTPSPAVSPVIPPSPSVSPVIPPSPAETPVSPPSPVISPVSPPLPVTTPVSPPTETPVLTPPANSPGGGSTPRGGGTTGNNPAADTTSPPAGAATSTAISGGVIATIVTTIFVLWGFF